MFRLVFCPDPSRLLLALYSNYLLWLDFTSHFTFYFISEQPPVTEAQSLAKIIPKNAPRNTTKKAIIVRNLGDQDDNWYWGLRWRIRVRQSLWPRGRGEWSHKKETKKKMKKKNIEKPKGRPSCPKTVKPHGPPSVKIPAKGSGSQSQLGVLSKSRLIKWRNTKCFTTSIFFVLIWKARIIYIYIFRAATNDYFCCRLIC